MRRFHKILGLIMLLPFIAWVVTGVFFFFKPGYQEAYQALNIKQYPVVGLAESLIDDSTLEVKQMQTILGHHVLIKNSDGWRHFLDNNEVKKDELTPEQIRLLINDAITQKKARYGDIVSIDGNKATTSTGVEVTVNWQGLSLRQYGQDTDFINTIYDIHYLRWTGNKAFDQYLGVIGLMLVLLLAVLGTWMSLRKPTIKY